MKKLIVIGLLLILCSSVYADENMEETDEYEDFFKHIAIQDFDDAKTGVQADSKVFTIDLLKGLGETSYYLKTRFTHV